MFDGCSPHAGVVRENSGQIGAERHRRGEMDGVKGTGPWVFTVTVTVTAGHCRWQR
jgi:hypothetical protein